MLSNKLKKARDGFETMTKAFEDLSSSLDKKDMEKWTKEEGKALEKGGKALCIYDLNLPKGLLCCVICVA